MKLIKNFTRPVTVEQINSELSGIGAQLIDIVQAGTESLMLYFDHIDGTADCLRLSAQRGPQGAPVLSVEFLPAEDENAQQEPAVDVQEIGSEDKDAADLVACYDQHTGGYFVADASTDTVVDAGPYALDVIVELWPGIRIESTEADYETAAE